jgi:hypothetical protein
MIIRGVRSSRFTWVVNDLGNTIPRDGHIWKVSAVEGVFEGNVIDIQPAGDCKHMLQLKAGGKWTIRGNYFLGGQGTNGSPVTMLREYGGPSRYDWMGNPKHAYGMTTNSAGYSAGATSVTLAATGTGSLPKWSLITFGADPTLYTVTSETIASVGAGGTVTFKPPLAAPIPSTLTSVSLFRIPNFPDTAGTLGNSIIFERNVFATHLARAALTFNTPGPITESNMGYMAAGTGQDQISSILCRDNIAMYSQRMITSMAYDYSYIYPSGFNDTHLISNDPTGGAAWTPRGNSTIAYDLNLAGFNNPHVFDMSRTAGAITASGSLSTKRFIYPHGYVDRLNDTHQGLG